MAQAEKILSCGAKISCRITGYWQYYFFFVILVIKIKAYRLIGITTVKKTEAPNRLGVRGLSVNAKIKVARYKRTNRTAPPKARRRWNLVYFMISFPP